MTINLNDILSKKIYDLSNKLSVYDFSDHIDDCTKFIISKIRQKISNTSTNIKIFYPYFIIKTESEQDKITILDIINKYKNNKEKKYVYIFLHTSIIAI